jgi:hypothetical protein
MNRSLLTEAGRGRWLWSGVLISLLLVAAVPEAAAAGKAKVPAGPLICVWEHDAKVDIAPIVRELGLNTLWAHDGPYNGKMEWKDTMMFRALQIPGLKYVLGKIDRKQWGWSYEACLKHAEWIAKLSLEHKEIIGLYLNDYWGEIDEGGKTRQQWDEITARARAINPALPIWAPLYPENGDLDKPWDFDHDAIMFNIWDDREVRKVEEYLTRAEQKHPGTPIVTGLYLNSGRAKEESWLSESDFKYILGVYVKHLNAGKTTGIRFFRAGQFVARPQYVQWAKEVLAGLKKPAAAARK